MCLALVSNQNERATYFPKISNAKYSKDGRPLMLSSMAIIAPDDASTVNSSSSPGIETARVHFCENVLFWHLFHITINFIMSQINENTAVEIFNRVRLNAMTYSNLV